MKKLLVFIVMACMVGSSASADLRGHWELDGNALDSSAYGNNGTIYGGVTPTEDRNGIPNGAMAFDGGSSTYIDLGDQPEFNITGAMTLMAWCWLDSSCSTAARVIAKQSLSRSWSLNTETTWGGITKPPVMWIASSSSSQVEVYDKATMPLDQWFHLAGVYTPGESMKLYINGVLVETRTDGVPASQFSNNGYSVRIGNRNAASTGWKGKLDDVRIYTDALSEPEIEAIVSEAPVVKANTPSPGDTETDIGINDTLSWTAGAYAISHDVYIGTDQNAVMNAQRLLGDINGDGPADILDLEILAGQWLTNPSAVNPSADIAFSGKVDFEDFAVLAADWQQSADAEFKGNQTGTTFDPGTLNPDTNYYWRIDEVNPSEPDSPWTGNVWSFTTASLQADSPSPADGATASVNTILSWTAGLGAVSHDVYFGIISPGTYQGNRSGTTFDPGTLDEGVVYYWRIDEISSYGTTTGTVWSFTATALPRVIVSTDIGGNDPDDFQSMVHYLVYADRFNTEGLIASPPYGGRVSDILATLDAYETDYNNLNSHAIFPTPQSLRNVSKQGATATSPSAGYSTATEGSNWIISCANKSDPRPLWILVWGSITDVAQAVHDDPSIKSKIRVYSIGSWNTQQDPYARNYLYNNHPDLWWIENDTTFRGMYIGGDQSGDLGNTTFVAQHVRYHGALGDFYYSKKTDIKMGDTPSVLYMLNGDQNDPTTAHWGGMFGTTGHSTNYWHDLTDPIYAESGYNGAKTVNVHRVSYLRDWQMRMDWADAP